MARASSVSGGRSEEHTSELQSLRHLVCRLLLEKNVTAGRPRCALSTARCSKTKEMRFSASARNLAHRICGRRSRGRWGHDMRSLKKALALACGIVAVLATLSLGFNLMNRPNSLALSAGFVVVVLGRK